MFCRLGTMIAVLGLSASAAYGSILPPNNLYLQDKLEAKTGITEAEFTAINQKARDLFGPIVRQHGGSLTINGNWGDSTVNASAMQLFGMWMVNMYGGLARRPEVTADGFTLVVCHEIGHHLAGFPFVSSWGANEGQSDFFATNHCSKLFWQDDAAGNARARDTIPAAMKAKCDDVYGTQSEQDLCYRNVMAGKSLADLLAALKNQTVDFSTPDTSVVTATNNAHPAGQCRLDTYVAGSLCAKEYTTTIIPGKRGGTGRNDREAEQESATYNCAEADSTSGDTRPLCWFHPGL